MKISNILLCSFLSLTACGRNSESKLDFASGEHVLIGNAAFKKVLAEANLSDIPASIRRADGKFDFTYGELVAFGGDLYRTPEDLDQDTYTQSWKTPLANNINGAREIFAGELDNIQEQIDSGKLDYKDNNIPFLAAFPSSYVSLAENNVDHFGWYNGKAYVKYHQAALDLALKANQSSAPEKIDLLRRALLTNAFADHFLTDGFASGHIRVPRTQSLQWGQKNGVNSKAIGGINKFLHDNDHTYATTKGLLVTNARGDEWRTRSDGQLAVASRLEDQNIALPIEAVELSLKELLSAYKDNQLPSSTFAAMNIVPWVSPKEDSLVATFPADLASDKLVPMLARIGIIWKLGVFFDFNENTARKYLGQLPSIMQQFQSDVRRESIDPVLQKTLPASYIEAYRNVR